MLAVLTPLLRHAAQVAAGALVTYGVIDASQAATIAGVIVSIGTVAWYEIERRLKKAR